MTPPPGKDQKCSQTIPLIQLVAAFYQRNPPPPSMLCKKKVIDFPGAENLIGGGGVLLRRTREAVKRNIAVLGIGKVKRPEENVHTLPKGVEDYEKVKLRMVGWSGMPARAAPLTEAGEGEIVETLVEELRTNFGVRVSENIDQDRSVTVVVQKW